MAGLGADRQARPMGGQCCELEQCGSVGGSGDTLRERKREEGEDKVMRGRKEAGTSGQFYCHK